MITFKTITFRNILSVGNAPVTITLDTHQNTLLTGKNGSAKSTIIEAISFALFGRAFRDITKNQIVNSINGKALMTELEFSNGSHEFKIIRGIKPNKFEIYKNGDLIEQTADVRDYQSMLENDILRMTHKTFSQVVAIGSATFTPFMKLPAGDRRKIIEDLLDLQVFSSMSLLAKGRIDQTRLDITEVKTKIESVTASIRSWELLIEESESASDEEINSVVAQIELAKDEIIKIEVSIAKHEHELDNLNEDISRIPASAEDLSNKHSKIISKVSEIETQASTMNKAIKFVQQHDDCPTCKQVITSEHKCQIIEENTSGIASLQSSHKKNKDNLKIVKDLMKQMSDMVSQVSEISNKVRMEKSSISNKQSLIGSYNDRIKSLCEKKSAEISYDNLNRLKGEIGAHNQSYDHLSARQNVLRDAQGLLKDSGIKAVIISKYIPRLNTIINNYLEKLDFFCSFHINEEFNETIKSRHRDIFSYASFSEGEKMRINISIMLALRDIARARNSATCNLLILDEVGDSSLDEAGTEEFLHIIKNLTEGQNNVFVISHKMGTQDGTFDRIIRAEKQGNFSAYTQIA